MKMKKRFLLLSCLLFCILIFSGCSGKEKDLQHAILELTVNSGRAQVKQSYNTDSALCDSAGNTVAINNPYRIRLKNEDDVVKMHFFCETCGYDEECEAGAPIAKLFSCKCPVERTGGSIAIREYYCVIISKKK